MVRNMSFRLQRDEECEQQHLQPFVPLPELFQGWNGGSVIDL